ncbi:TIGR00341 family protein [Patescibacteria group bacterium]|nr:TIGR00341 family protein [Patescibacteria group bacterium]MBU2219104.1 TIGR00341 family protein [Patescibacteria group bacterium]MBU2263184.1 TIGR00341 family protein [Patescibacteria group bacterium]
MKINIFNNLTEKEKTDAVEGLIKNSTPHQDFFMMVIFSILMATFGLLLDSPAVVIGSMLIAPILYPILSLSLGIVMSDQKLITRALFTILKSAGLGIAAAIIITLFLSDQGSELTSEIIARTYPSLLYIAVAVIAGLAVSFALIKPQLNETLPGIAVSVAIIPPLAVIGIGIAKLNWAVISGSFLLLLINILGIVFASMIIFSLMNLYVKKKVAQEVAKKEDKKLEQNNA